MDFSALGSRILGYLTDALYLLPVILLSLSFHECSHAFIANKLGDPTAKQQGRLTMNPLKHIDPLGFLMMLIIHFGYAKPVPVNPMYFKNPKKGMMLTALAGPVSNILLAIICSPIAVFMLIAQNYAFENASGAPAAIFNYFTMFFFYMVVLNVGLAVFNFIPIYPLDGGRIFGYFMPERFNDFFRRYSQYIYIAFIVLVLATDYVGMAISAVQTAFLRVFIFIWGVPMSALVQILF